MAQRALPPGTIQRRTFFGLLDADGWAVAFGKALFWFALIIFLLGYIPDRAYYFTVLPTLDVGYNVISPINFCDGANRTLPCPAPLGSVVPWDPSPPQLNTPAGRANAGAFQLGTDLFVVGGASGGGATESVLATTTTSDGNYAPWREGPRLPAQRSEAAVVSFNGTPYVLGGLDGSGNPTDTVIVGTIKDGKLTGWSVADKLKLPQPLAGAAATTNATGIWVIGGQGAHGPSASVYRARLDNTVKPAALLDFNEQPALQVRLGTGEPAPRAHAAALLSGSHLYLVGGDGPQGASNLVFRLDFDSKGEPKLNAQAQVIGWGQSTGAASLPVARTRYAGFTANSTLYVPGGLGPDGKATKTLYWAVPEAATGDIAVWRHLDETDLAMPLVAATPAVVGSFAFLIGGQGADGKPVAASERAYLAPRAPFFRLGFLGATIPALSITGKDANSFGYIAAGTAGAINFILLIAIGVAYSHRAATQRLLERLSRGRYRAPQEDEYFSP